MYCCQTRLVFAVRQEAQKCMKATTRDTVMEGSSISDTVRVK